MLIGDRPDEDRLNVVLRLRDTPVSIAIGQIALDVAVVEVRAAGQWPELGAGRTHPLLEPSARENDDAMPP